MNVDLHMKWPNYAVHWASQLETSVSSLVSLKGGINNRVFRCGFDGNHQWVIKGYDPCQSGCRDKMKAEVDFLRYALQVAPGFTPGLVCTDWERRCVVLQYLDGESFPEGITPPQEAIKAAANFFNKLNLDLHTAKSAIELNAAEGYLSLREHISNIQERLDRMMANHLQGRARLDADRLLNFLRTELEQITHSTSMHISQGNIADSISPEQLYISPSDFGFHNAILTKNGVRFFDFEFAGWDDPSKAVIDFELQPRIPVSRSFSLIDCVKLKDRQAIQARCSFLKPILQLKWCCIALNILNPARLTDMLNVNPQICEQQFISERLETAKKYLKCLTACTKLVFNG